MMSLGIAYTWCILCILYNTKTSVSCLHCRYINNVISLSSISAVWHTKGTRFWAYYNARCVIFPNEQGFCEGSRSTCHSSILNALPHK